MTILQSGISQAASGGYKIARSLRFNSADTATLTRTPASASNRKTWTWSGWVKRSVLGTKQGFFESYAGGAGLTAAGFETDNKIIAQLYDTGANYNTVFASSAVFRDVNAWYHIVIAFDTTQASASNHVKLYVNGVQQTFTLTNYASAIPQNTDFFINSTNIHYISHYETANYFSGYMTEIHFIDGQALTPSSFGETDTNTGVWNPKLVTGMTYGTNGFYLKFSDNSNTTAATLGKDSSSNGNNWTPTNFSVTAGVGNDSLVDSPTNYGTDTGIGGEVRGNYCTLNPLDKGPDVNTVVNGNLDATWNSNSGHTIRSTMSVSSGKWYWEFTNVNNLSCGVVKSELKIIPASGSLWPGSDGFGAGGSFAYRPDNGNKTTNSTGTSYGATFTTTDVIGCALDLDNGKIWWSKNGTFIASGDPAAGTNEAYSGLSGTFSPAWGYINPGAQTLTVNFGQRAFAYTAPSGFKALCTQNLPTPAIGASSTTLANKNFDTLLWTGASETGTASITGLNFQPDFVWSKGRSGGNSHLLYDVIRGPSTSGASKALSSNDTVIEGSQNDNSTYGYLSAFNSNGFSYFGGSSPTYFSTNAGTYVGWNWKGGGAGVSNTSGTITSTVSANPTAGFSVVTYTGNGTSGATFGHGLGAVPKMIIFKCRNFAYQWLTYHVALGNTAFVTLDTDQAQATSRGDFLNSTTPSSSLITLGNTAGINESTKTYVAYCFSEVAGYSKFGSYVGNGSTDAPFAYCGFRPKFLMVKSTGSASWMMYDTSRSTYNVNNIAITADLTLAELNSTDWSIDILSNGFKYRTTYGQVNNSGTTYIFMAFAESPFNYSRAR
jgi:hypothetical protein